MEPSLVKQICAANYLKRLSDGTKTGDFAENVFAVSNIFLRVYISCITLLYALLWGLGRWSLLWKLAQKSCFARLILDRYDSFMALEDKINVGNRVFLSEAHASEEGVKTRSNWKLIASIDLFLGLFLGLAMLNFDQEIATAIYKWLQRGTIDFLREYIDWLMGWPAGLKLNCSLSNFFGIMYLCIVRIWALSVCFTLPTTMFILRLVAIIGVLLGSSSIVALAIDFVYFSTLHIKFCYFLSARLFTWEIHILASLFHLFRGKKWNVLRERLDSADYDLDQLLLGTILFACLAFIWPTVMVYYLLFSTSFCYWIGLRKVGELLAILLTKTPLHSLFGADQGEPNGIEIDLHQGRILLTVKPKPMVMSLLYLRRKLADCIGNLVNLTNLAAFLKGRPIRNTRQPIQRMSFRWPIDISP